MNGSVLWREMAQVVWKEKKRINSLGVMELLAVLLLWLQGSWGSDAQINQLQRVVDTLSLALTLSVVLCPVSTELGPKKLGYCKPTIISQGWPDLIAIGKSSLDKYFNRKSSERDYD